MTRILLVVLVVVLAIAALMILNPGLWTRVLEDVGITEPGLYPEEEFPEGGANDVRDILIRGEEYLFATGVGVMRYRVTSAGAEFVEMYTVESGLASSNVVKLHEDAAGGIWALCDDGVAVLSKGAKTWTPFTAQKGLAPGQIYSMAFSNDRQRVWVVSSDGLATKMITDSAWVVYPGETLRDVHPSPDGRYAWCNRIVPSSCMCGRVPELWQFTVASKRWDRVAETHHGWTIPVCENGRVWLPGTPPKRFDPATRMSKTWPSEPNWETTDEENVQTFSDSFGDMLPANDGSGDVWHATGVGLWRYGRKSNQWTPYRLRKKSDSGYDTCLVCSIDGKTIYWAEENVMAAFDVPSKTWTPLWKHVERDEWFGRPQRLIPMPDGNHLWRVDQTGIWVLSLTSKKAIALSDEQIPGLGWPGTVRVDPARKRVLIATLRGVVLCDFAGQHLTTLQRSDCPITGVVERFEFAPDGSEVWCIQKDNGHRGRRSAVVLYPAGKRWEEVPTPQQGREFRDVKFSKDGKTTWLALSRKDKCNGLLERTTANRNWVPIRQPMPEYYTVEQLWLSPEGDELWTDNDGCGVYRIKHATQNVSQYIESDCRTSKELSEHHPLADDYVEHLVFTPDGRHAICNVGPHENGIAVIDRKTGRPTHYSRDRDVRGLAISPDAKSVVCVMGYDQPTAVFDLKTRTWSKGPVESPKDPPVTDGLGYPREDEIRSEANLNESWLVQYAKPLEDRYVVAVFRDWNSNLYLYACDLKKGDTTMVMNLEQGLPTVMRLGPKGKVWLAMGGSVVSVDPKTGAMEEYGRTRPVPYHYHGE